MVKNKIPFEKRITTVLNIIRENKEPIGYTELYGKVKAETKVKISKHTLNKCLDHLLFTRQIEKIKNRGKGNPVKFSINQESFATKPFERIKGFAYILEHLLENDSPFGTEAIHYRIIASEISLLVTRMIFHLSEASKQNDCDKAFDSYKLALDTELYPYMLEIGKLAQSPIKMSPLTVSLLEKIFYENVYLFCMQQNNPLEEITKDELDFICSLYENDSPDSEYVYQKTEIPEILELNNLYESNYLDMYIEEKEIFAKVLKELRQKKNTEES